MVFPSEAPPPSLSFDALTEWISFDNDDPASVLGSPTVWVEVRGPSGSEEALCLIDTGASSSVFPHTWVETLGLEPVDLERSTREVAGAGALPGRVSKRTGLVEVQIGDRIIPLRPFFVDPVTDANGEYEHDLYVLGLEIFFDSLVTFDFTGRRMRFEARPGGRS
jgi:hypothetical protein